MFDYIPLESFHADDSAVIHMFTIVQGRTVCPRCLVLTSRKEGSSPNGPAFTSPFLRLP